MEGGYIFRSAVQIVDALFRESFTYVPWKQCGAAKNTGQNK